MGAIDIERLLLNVFFVVLPLFILPILLYKVHSYKRICKIVICISSIISALLCMMFSIPIGEGVILDFRDIPLLIGSLYGGPFVSIIISVFIVGFRLLIGGAGIFPAIIIASLFILLSIFLSTKFQVFTKRFRINVSILLSIASLLLVVLFIKINTGEFYITFNEFLIYFIIHTFSVFLVVHVSEFIMEANKLQKLKIESEKSELVGHLAASISHEIRNPLTSVRGFLQMLLEDTEIDRAKKEMFLSISIDELDHAERVIRDYLTFAKPAPERIEKFNIKEQIEFVLNVLKPLANTNSVVIEKDLSSHYIKGEIKLFHQCFINILKNSIEAMGHGGTLKIQTCKSDKKFHIIVSDTGIGMTEEQLKRIGEPYFTTKGSKGTGLGMLVVMNIIKEMNGNIEITSKLHKGTTYKITFPEWKE